MVRRWGPEGQKVKVTLGYTVEFKASLGYMKLSQKQISKQTKPLFFFKVYAICSMNPETLTQPQVQGQLLIFPYCNGFRDQSRDFRRVRFEGKENLKSQVAKKQFLGMVMLELRITI